MNRRNEDGGFTIVELIIVIVVIGILAAITIVAYGGVQQRARDVIRKNDIAEVGKALQFWSVDNGPMSSGSGCGGSGNGNGWYGYEGSGYTTSISNCLKNAGYINKDIVDPSGLVSCGGLSCRAYIITSCTQSGTFTTYIYVNLETVGHTSTDTDSTCDPSKDTAVGSNYFVKVTF